MLRRSLAAVAFALVLTWAAPAQAIRLEMFKGQSAAPDALNITGAADGSAWMTGQFGELAHILADGTVVFPKWSWWQSPTVTSAVWHGGQLWVNHGGVLERYAEDGTKGTIDSSPSANFAYSLTRGADGSMWFLQATANSIGHVTREGKVTLFSAPTPGAFAGGGGIAFGADGNVWFTEVALGMVGRLTPQGGITEFPLPPQATLQGAIAAGRDGNLYLSLVGAIGRLNTAGYLTGKLTGGISDLAPQRLIGGPDGALWFNEYQKDQLSRMLLPDGRIEHYFIERAGRYVRPTGLDIGADGTLWFFEFETSAPGRVLFDPPRAQTAASALLDDGRARLSGAAAGRGVATTVAFEYGPTAAYGSTTAAQSASEAEDAVPVEALTEPLTAGETYHYRLVATSAVGRTVGEDRTFTVPAPPPPVVAATPTPVVVGPPDADGDGFPANVDCDDASVAVHPGAADTPANRRDEDCSGADAAYPRFAPVIDATWNTKKQYVVFNHFSIDFMPASASLQLSCAGRGCRVKRYSATISRSVRGLNLLTRLKGSQLRRNAVVELRLSRPGYVTTITRWTIGKPSRRTILCLPPGVKVPQRC